jgi:CDP-paratose 2-epimerase
MRYLVTGGCGFVGAAICRHLLAHADRASITVLDNHRRRGSELNRRELEQLGVRVLHGDVRAASDLEEVGGCDWVIDAAAEPSALAGVSPNQGTSRRQLVEHNLVGTLHLIELAARWNAGVVFLSTSRVYSIAELLGLPLRQRETRDASPQSFVLDTAGPLPTGVDPRGITELFPTSAPVSLYGATKLAGELMAAEYCHATGTPLIIDRCGVMAGAGQFGKADQGIFSWWIHSWAARRPLSYIGFGGTGLQVRDCLHPLDLAELVVRQMRVARGGHPEVVNVSGGQASATSLAELSAWCRNRFGDHSVGSTPETRGYDVPWIVLNSDSAAARFEWRPTRSREQIFEEIASHAQRHPEWLDCCGG